MAADESSPAAPRDHRRRPTTDLAAQEGCICRSAQPPNRGWALTDRGPLAASRSVSGNRHPENHHRRTERAYDNVIPESTTSHLEVPATPAPPKGDVVSNDLHRPRTALAADDATAAPVASFASATTYRVPHTRTGAAWFGLCAAAFLFVVLIVFMVQNTSSVEVAFVWMHGSLPLALALLIAAVGAAILAVVIGAARITQLRRLYRRRY
jgi:uncharacterized integral membrane protein